MIKGFHVMVLNCDRCCCLFIGWRMAKFKLRRGDCVSIGDCIKIFKDVQAVLASLLARVRWVLKCDVDAVVNSAPREELVDFGTDERSLMLQ